MQQPLSDQEMEDLLRKLAPRRPPAAADFEFPPPEALVPYLEGTADQVQEGTVLPAVARSRVFRRILMGLSADLAHIRTEAGQEALRRVEAPGERLALSGRATAGSTLRRPAPGLAADARPRGGWQSFRDLLAESAALLLRRPAVGAAALLALVVVVFAIPEWRYVHGSWLYHGSYPPDTFIADEVRSSLPTSQAEAPEEFQAALFEFMDRIRYEGGEFLDNPTAPLPESPDRPRRIRLLLVGQRGFRREVEAKVPDHPTPVRAWRLSVPSGRLESLEVKGDRTRARWEQGDGEEAWVLFTYPLGTQYAATRAVLVGPAP